MSGDLFSYSASSQLVAGDGAVAVTPRRAEKPKRKRRKVAFIVHEGEGNTRRIEPIGRDAWMLGKLVTVGAKGITTLECGGAPRVSGYIHKLRHNYHVAISSTEEQHDGQFAGRHVRYHLQQKVEFANPSDAEGL